MVCELAGSYDLLVPLMLAEGIAFVALRKHALYHAQVTTKRDSPAHRDDLILDFLKGIRVDEILVKDRPLATFARNAPASEVIRVVANADFQDAFPVLGARRQARRGHHGGDPAHDGGRSRGEPRRARGRHDGRADLDRGHATISTTRSRS